MRLLANHSKITRKFIQKKRPTARGTTLLVFLLYTLFFAFHYIVIRKRQNSLQFLQIELSFVCFFVTFSAYFVFLNDIEKR